MLQVSLFVCLVITLEMKTDIVFNECLTKIIVQFSSYSSMKNYAYYMYTLIAIQQQVL